MTRDQIAARVASNLDDLGVFYTSDDINNSIQDGYDDVVSFTACIEKRSDGLSFTSGLVYYDFSSLITDYYACRSIFNNNTNRYLIPTSQRSLRTTRLDWEVSTGEPQFWCPIDFKRAGFWQHNVTATGTFNVLYAAKADLLSSNIVPQIHGEYQDLLEKYATGDLLEQQEEFTKAVGYFKEYYALLDIYFGKVEALAKADRMFTLNETVVI